MTKKLAFVLAAALAGCMSSGSGEVRNAGDSDTPNLVMIDDGVQVVADANDPTFYADHSFWMYRHNGWYRADRYHGAWTYVDAPPERLRRINDPMAYANYRAERGTQSAFNEEPNRVPQPEARQGYPDIPDQRNDLPPSQESTRNPPPQPSQPYANPRPPQQEPPVMPDGPGTTDVDDRPDIDLDR